MLSFYYLILEYNYVIMRIYLIIFSLIFCGTKLGAQSPGDTTVIETLDFNDITKRRGWQPEPQQPNKYSPSTAATARQRDRRKPRISRGERDHRRLEDAQKGEAAASEREPELDALPTIHVGRRAGEDATDGELASEQRRYTAVRSARRLGLRQQRARYAA